jgi:hypothetical protein
MRREAGTHVRWLSSPRGAADLSAVEGGVNDLPKILVRVDACGGASKTFKKSPFSGAVYLCQ